LIPRIVSAPHFVRINCGCAGKIGIYSQIAFIFDANAEVKTQGGFPALKQTRREFSDGSG